MLKRKRNLWLRFDRALAHDLLQQVAILFGMLCVAFVLSYFLLELSGCQWKNFCNDAKISELLLPLYLLIDTNALNSLYIGGEHGWALFAATIVYIIGVVIFNGMIISVMTNAIERRVQSHQDGKIHYLKSGHYVVMGYDDMVPSIIHHVLDLDKDSDVLLLTSENVIKIKEDLQKYFDVKLRKRIIVNYGHRTSLEDYKEIHFEAAEEIYIVGNRCRPAHDAINVECVDSICKYLKAFTGQQLPKRITCVFEDLDTYAAFKTSEIFQNVKALNIEFVPYNFYVEWAKQVFINQCHKDKDGPTEVVRYPKVYGANGITPEDERYVHLVFVGTTNFAVSFAMEAAHVLHFPNSDKQKTRITFIDKNADKEKDEFIIRNRHFFEIQTFYYYDLTNEEDKNKELQGPRNEFVRFKGDNANFLDVEFEFIKGDVFSKKVQDEIEKWAEDTKGQYLSIFLALANQRDNFVMGMNMPDEVYANSIPLFIRQDRSDNFVTNLRNADKKDDDDKYLYSSVKKDGTLDEPQKRDARYANIYPFGMNEMAFTADETLLKRAKLINYLYSTADYRTYRFQGLLTLTAIPEQQIWAEADKYWKDLNVALKWSNLYNAYSLPIKLDSLRAIRGLKANDISHEEFPLTEKEVEIMAEVEHNRWNVEKLLMGYRKAKLEEDKYEHEEYKDKLKKNKNLFIHHDIRPFGKLDDTIKELDREFSRYIPWILSMTPER